MVYHSLHQPSQSESANLRRAIPFIELIVDRAKVDRKGVYWPVAPAFKHLPAAQLDATLAAGTSGIVLALVEFFRATGDSTVGELIAKATAWLDTREQTRNFTPGFYFGSGGWWYLQTRLHDVLPELHGKPSERIAESLGKLAAAPLSEAGTVLAMGFAGTLIGALSAGLESDDKSREVLSTLPAALAQRSRLSPAGIFWDFFPHAVRPSTGFLNGSAGVDYAFAAAKRVLGCNYPKLVASSVRHANATYDTRMANWPDFEGTELFRKLGDAGVAKLVQQTRGQPVAKGALIEDSLGWGNGAAGILLSRAAVADAFRGHPLVETCLADCRRAIERLARATEAELTGLDPCLQNGLAGIALAAKAYQATGAAAHHSLPAEFELRVIAHLERRSETAGSDDLSLLTGAAGLAYAWLKLDSASPEVSCLNPISPSAESCAAPAKGEEALPVVIERRLPRTAVLMAGESSLNIVDISLSAIEQATADYRAKQAAALEVKAADYELGLHRQLAEIPSFHHHLFREAYKRMRFAQSYGEGMNDTLLLERFRLDEDATLMELEFDPSDAAPEIKPEKTLVIRYRGSHGILDAKLSTLQQGLLERFRTPAVVIEAIGDVIERVQTPHVTQRQLAGLALKQIRAFVAAGYLFPETPGKIRSALIRKRWRRARMNLFPAEANR